MKSDFEERRQNRKDRYEELADKNRQQSEERYEAALSIGNRIPMGQPILVGHHSERGHRADLKRIDNNMRKSVEHSDKARYYKQKAQVIENDLTVYSDDPEAIQKLKYRLSEMKQHQEWMKAINKLCRSRKLTDEQIAEQLQDEHGFSVAGSRNLLNPQYSLAASRYQKRGFQTWRLSNNNANIRRIKERIEQLGKAETEGTTEQAIGEAKLVDSVEHNRLQIFFPDKPSTEVRAQLKQQGFRGSAPDGPDSKSAGSGTVATRQCIRPKRLLASTAKKSRKSDDHHRGRSATFRRSATEYSFFFYFSPPKYFTHEIIARRTAH